jgi:hypothetical protein
MKNNSVDQIRARPKHLCTATIRALWAHQKRTQKEEEEEKRP